MQVNPHFFGKIRLKKKNKKTRFFIESTVKRKYNYIISAAEKLKYEKYEFEICSVGHVKDFSYQNINEKIKNNFIFNYNVNFSTLYKLVDSSDYIIINLDPNKNSDYKDKKVTGAIQLTYGFIKPCLINIYFKDTYNMTEENSFLFEEQNFYNAMKKAILLNNYKYKKMQRSLLSLARKIYGFSLLNIKKSLNYLSINY